MTDKNDKPQNDSSLRKSFNNNVKITPSTGKTQTPPDPPKVPKHYEIEGLKEESIEVIEAVIDHNANDPVAGYFLGNCLKYLFRFGRKNGVEDLRKAQDFLGWLIERLEEK